MKTIESAAERRETQASIGLPDAIASVLPAEFLADRSGVVNAMRDLAEFTQATGEHAPHCDFVKADESDRTTIVADPETEFGITQDASDRTALFQTLQAVEFRGWQESAERWKRVTVESFRRLPPEESESYQRRLATVCQAQRLSLWCELMAMESERRGI